jgi:hypothetical protein
MISSERMYDTLLDAGWVGYDDISNCKIPKECLNHLKGIWGDDGEHNELLNNGQFWTLSCYPGDRYHPFLKHLWMYHNFYKITRKHNWDKETSYLLGEIMWLLLERGNRGIDETSYNQHIFHKKEKGIERTSFNKCKRSLRKTNGHSWLKKKQGEIGDIIEDRGDTIYLSDEWFYYLLKC